MSTRARKAPRLHNEGDSPNSKHARSTSGSTQRSYASSEDASYEFDEEFASIGVVELLDIDPRPTFALRLDSDLDNSFEPVFINSSLLSDAQLKKALSFKHRSLAPLQGPKSSNSDFKAWIKTVSHHHDCGSSYSFSGVLWTAFIVQQWTVVSGDHATSMMPTSISLRRGASSTALSDHQADSRNESFPPKPRRVPTGEEISLLEKEPGHLEASFQTPGTPDWTLAQPEGQLSPHVIFVRSIDWAATPLGDMSTWSREFRQVVCLLMANPHPAALFWGEELTVVYNKAYAEGVAGNKHPGLMGTGFRGPFAEIWDSVGSIFNECRRTGQSVAVTEQMLPIERHGFLEETFYTWSLTPLYGGTDHMLGLYNAPFETTKQTRGARAMRTLVKLSQETALAESVKSFWPKILIALEDNPWDFPFAILYSVSEDSEEDSMSESSDVSQVFKTCTLEGTLGVPSGHHAAPENLDLKRSRGGFVPYFRDAIQTREPTLLSAKDGTLSETLIEGFEWLGFGEPCREAIVCPIRPTTGESIIGFMVVGVNPRRQFDGDYQSFIQLLDRQLATSLASVTLLEAEVRRGHSAAEAAALERSRLSEELAVQKSRLQRIAEVSPVGMYSIDKAGTLLEANSRYWEMTGHPKNDLYPMSWVHTIHEDSVGVSLEGWRKLTIDRLPWDTELRLKKPWHDPVTGEEIENWVIAACQPEFSSKGELKTIMGSITDVSRIKWAENMQTRRLQEAEETRRAQNNFIDITSHEMRNPLSAVLQCADGIASSLSEVLADLRLESDSFTMIRDSIKESVSSAETIQLCAQHQKSIVDDILTISKLDSNLLVIAPVPVQPVDIVRQALQMFMVECEKIHDIRMQFLIDDSFDKLHVNSVMLDPSRLLQVLINLLTNAIKFTKSAPKRTINVSISAHLEAPLEQGADFEYFPTKKARSNVTATSDWGNGEILYLRFQVQDSGCGLDAEEKKKLFNRFSQASPRTHVQYGGSGLGLFISRQLTELQGGEIGVASEAGIGSTFAFYVKSRRAEGHPDTANISQKLSFDIHTQARLATNSPQGSKSIDQKEVADMVDASTALQISVPESNPKDWYVLIVEDNLVNQKILAQQIRKLGSHVVVANHGQEALDKIKETKHYRGRADDGKNLSVVLMDLEMPVMDGLTCVRKIREMEASGELSSHLPIIAVTANARAEQIASAKDSGMDDVMPKPFRILQIRTKIEALLQPSGKDLDLMSD